MGSGPENYSLKWQHFHQSIASAFKDLRNDDEFLDVTIACDEDQQIQAHKVIISACSPYFKSMLQKHRGATNPVLIMPDTVRFHEIISILDFMYYGEVSIPSEEVNNFLSTAKQFKVRGLMEEEPAKMRQRQFLGKPRPAQPSPSVPPDIRQRLPPGIQMVKRPSCEPSPLKRPRLYPPGKMNHQFMGEDEEDEDDITEIGRGDDDGGEYYDGDGYQDYDESPYQEAPHPAVPPTPGSQLMGLVCPQCNKVFKGVQVLKDHMVVCKFGGRTQGQPGGREVAAEEPQESLCHICDKSFKNHRTLDNHLKKQHGLSGSTRAMSGSRGRGRPKKSPVVSEWGGEGFEGSYSEPGASQPLHRGRPVGQVAPQRVTDTVPVSRPGPSPGPGRGRGLPRGGGARAAEGVRRGPEAKPDLQKLGLKFGGQISITSSGNQPGASKKAGQLTPVDNQGVSVTKMKGDVAVGTPVSIKDAKNKQGASEKSAGESSQRETEHSEIPNVKEEPSEAEVETEEPDNFDEYDDGDYGDGNDVEGDYIGPADAMYGDDPDFAGDDVDGLDVDYYRYKNRDGEYEEEEEPPVDEEFEEES